MHEKKHANLYHEELRRETCLRSIALETMQPVLIEAGVNKGGYTVYFRDCNGITLEMVQPPVR